MSSQPSPLRLSPVWWNDPTSGTYRAAVLACTCLLTFGSYYVFDMPSVLEDELQDFLNINSTKYNLFYSLYGWTNMAMSLVAGWIVDRVGYRLSAYIFLTLVILGQALFALGTSIDATDSTRFLIMCAGRFIFGTGGGSITIVQNAIVTYWFKGKELALAFGIALTSSRAGSVINFFTTKDLVNNHGLSWTTWYGACLCCVGVLAAFGFHYLDTRANRLRGDSSGEVQGRVVNFKDVKKFRNEYWLVALTITTFYVCVFPFVADAPKFFDDRFGYNRHSSEGSILTSMVYLASLALSPLLGLWVDRFGKRTSLSIFGTALTIPVFILFGYTHVSPYVGMIGLGIGYSVCAAALWPSISLIVPTDTIGTAMGVATSLQMLGIAIFTLVVGAIKDSHFSWTGVMFFFAIMAGVSCCCAFILYLVDERAGGDLSRPKYKQDGPARLSVAEEAEIEPLLMDFAGDAVSINAPARSSGDLVHRSFDE